MIDIEIELRVLGLSVLRPIRVLSTCCGARGGQPRMKTFPLASVLPHSLF
jgi:hypothetical protein